MLSNGIVDISDFGKWRQGSNKFQRRAVPVSLICQLEGHDNYDALFEFIEPLMMDSEKTVQQGVGWFLREAWKLKQFDTETFSFSSLRWKDAPRCHLPTQAVL